MLESGGDVDAGEGPDRMRPTRVDITEWLALDCVIHLCVEEFGIEIGLENAALRGRFKQLILLNEAPVSEDFKVGFDQGRAVGCRETSLMPFLNEVIVSYDGYLNFGTYGQPAA